MKPAKGMPAPVKSKPVDVSKQAAKPTKSLPAGMTVGKPKAVAAAMKPMLPSKKLVLVMPR